MSCKEFTQSSKGKKQIYCSLRCNKAATKARAKVKAEAEKASATQELSVKAEEVKSELEPETKSTISQITVPIEPQPLDAPLKLSESVSLFAPLENRDVAVTPMPEPPKIPPRLIGQVVLPIQGDPPPGRSAYDKMLRGEE